MTKIVKQTEKKIPENHIDDAFSIINDYLPYSYVERVQAKLKDNKITPGIIRNVKSKSNNSHFKHIQVVNALLEVALEEKNALARLKDLLQ